MHLHLPTTHDVLDTSTEQGRLSQASRADLETAYEESIRNLSVDQRARIESGQITRREMLTSPVLQHAVHIWNELSSRSISFQARRR